MPWRQQATGDLSNIYTVLWICRLIRNSHFDYRADAQAKGLQEHIGVVEDNFSSLLQNFAAISRKCGKLRDKGDLLVKSMREYSELETPSVKSSLGACAECFAGLEDYREAMVPQI